MAGVDAGQLLAVNFYPAEYGIVEHASEQTYCVNYKILSFMLACGGGDLRGQPLEQLYGVLLLSDVRRTAHLSGRSRSPSPWRKLTS